GSRRPPCSASAIERPCIPSTHAGSWYSSPEAVPRLWWNCPPPSTSNRDTEPTAARTPRNPCRRGVADLGRASEGLDGTGSGVARDDRALLPRSRPGPPRQRSATGRDRASQAADEQTDQRASRTKQHLSRLRHTGQAGRQDTSDDPKTYQTDCGSH